MDICFNKKNSNKIDFPSILDREIEHKENARFGHIHFAEILFSLIKNNEPPFSIGLLGKWGVGKSSIKKLCRNEFLLKEPSKYKIIDFNAWRYESKDIRKSLLKEIYVALDGKEETIISRLFKEVSKTVDKDLPFIDVIINLFKTYRTISDVSVVGSAKINEYEQITENEALNIWKILTEGQPEQKAFNNIKTMSGTA